MDRTTAVRAARLTEGDGLNLRKARTQRFGLLRYAKQGYAANARHGATVIVTVMLLLSEPEVPISLTQPPKTGPARM
jgi:hypothetical protein